MGVIDTTRRHRRLQTFANTFVLLFLLYDARYGTYLRNAYGDIGVNKLALWSMLSLLGILGPSAVGVTVWTFYGALKPSFWTEGGREQFAHAKGYAVATYLSILTFLVVLWISPSLLKYRVVVLNRGLTILLTSLLLQSIMCAIVGGVVFRRYAVRLFHH
jgi:hypothetical protein